MMLESVVTADNRRWNSTAAAAGNGAAIGRVLGAHRDGMYSCGRRKLGGSGAPVCGGTIEATILMD